MTNEERIEERLIDAHKRGYYDQVMTRVVKESIMNPKMDKYRIYEEACDFYKAEWLKEHEKNENGTTEHTPN